MKATLEFDLDNLDDATRHEQCVRSRDMAAVLFEIQHNMKDRIKHLVEDNRFESQGEVLDYTFEQIHAQIAEMNINT